MAADALRENKWRYAEALRARRERWALRRPGCCRVLDRALGACVGGYARLELPRSVGLAETAAHILEFAWPREGVREVTGLWHGYRLRLDCADYFQRLTSIVRRYPDVPTQMLIWRAVRPGDTVIDGGANIGLVSLLSAWRVGPRGLVHAFEPSPGPLDSLRWHARENRLTQLRVHACGLSDEDAETELVIPGEDNLGAGTLAPPPARYGGKLKSRSIVRAARADGLGLEVRGALVVKLDVEGFELRALRGMAGLIERHRPLIVTEVNEEMLAQAGATSAGLAAFLMDRGYEAYGYTTRRAVVRQRRLELKPASRTAMPVDVVWLHPQSTFAGRLAAYTTA